jgi:hypothetical protein
MFYPGKARSFSRRAAAVFGFSLSAITLQPGIARAADLDDPAGKPAASQSPGGSGWTVSVEAIALERSGGASRTLVALLPGSMAFCATAGFLYPNCNSSPVTGGTQVFNSSQFQQRFSAGPDADLIYRGGSGYGAELAYFNIFNQSATKSVGPDDQWLIQRAPGYFWQTQDYPNQAMVWGDTTNLFSAEANGRLDLSSRVTVLAGFRWLQLNDSLGGTLTPPDVYAPTWKSTNPNAALPDVPLTGPTLAGNYPPFWVTDTQNNLFGLQIGVDGKLLELGRFSLEGQLKAGIFDNYAKESTGVSLAKQVHPSEASANGAAYAGEASLKVKYRISERLGLKAGYEALWLGQVALAPGQIQETHTGPTGDVRALGVNMGSSVLFQGFTAGLEYSF